MPQLEPVVLFFVLGLVAGLIRSDLKVHGILYDSLSIFLLLAIGLKGGVELARHSLPDLLLPSLAVVAVGSLIPLLAFPVLRLIGKLPAADAGSIAAHYGSVSVVTFAVALSYLARLGEATEGYMVVFLVLLEFPALVIGVMLARRGERDTPWRKVLHEVFAGKSIVLLLGGLLIGWLAGPDGIAPLDTVFFGMFHGMLAIFLLELGLVVARRVGELLHAGAFLVAFAILMPLAAATLGLFAGTLLGLSVGGVTLLATLYASASYIAAPAAMRIALPEANPAISIAAALGVTFPFNIVAGIPLYHWLAQALHRAAA